MKYEQTQGDKMTAEQAAREFFDGLISAWTVRDLWRRGEIPGVKCGGRLIFSRIELTKWYEEQSRASVWQSQDAGYGKLRVAK